MLHDKHYTHYLYELIVLCFVAWGAVSCTDPIDPVDPHAPAPAISIPDSCTDYFALGLTLGHEATETVITFEASTSWELTLTNDTGNTAQWCNVYPQYGGEGTHAITLNTESNTSPYGRMAQLLVTTEEEVYTIDIHNYSRSRLPAVLINYPDTLTIPSKTEPWIEGAEITIINADGTIGHKGKTSIRGRGNSTWGYPKKPYNLKLDNKAEVLGMPSHKRWALMANWMDRTLMRNHVAFEVARCTDMAWNPHGEFVELMLNGIHQGNYYLCEQIKIDENRVNIGPGGQLLELDTYYDETFKFWSKLGEFPYMLKDPDIVTQQEFESIRDYVNHLEEVLYDDKALARGDYRELMDVDSYVDWWFVYELTNCREPNHPKSTYMYKEAGGKLYAGPVWDFDWGGFRLERVFVATTVLYYPRLFLDFHFVERVKERWTMLKPRFEQIPNFIDAEAERIKASEEINHAMWPISSNINGDETLTFDEAIERMKRAYLNKLKWMNEEIRNM